MTRHSVDTSYPISSVAQYFVQNWSCINSVAISVFVLLSVQVYPVVFLIYFISAVVTLLASLAVMVQFPIPCNRTGRTSVLYSFIFFSIITVV